MATWLDYLSFIAKPGGSDPTRGAPAIPLIEIGTNGIQRRMVQFNKKVGRMRKVGNNKSARK